MMLETHSAYWAAIRATPSDLADMKQSLDEMQSSIDDVEAFRDADIKFHVQIAEATQNSMLISLINMMRQYFVTWIQERLFASPINAAELAEISLSEHQAIFDKILEHDGDGARDAMAAHIGTASIDLRANLKDAATDK